MIFFPSYEIFYLLQYLVGEEKNTYLNLLTILVDIFVDSNLWFLDIISLCESKKS